MPGPDCEPSKQKQCLSHHFPRNLHLIFVFCFILELFTNISQPPASFFSLLEGKIYGLFISGPPKFLTLPLVQTFPFSGNIETEICVSDHKPHPSNVVKGLLCSSLLRQSEVRQNTYSQPFFLLITIHSHQVLKIGPIKLWTQRNIRRKPFFQHWLKETNRVTLTIISSLISPLSDTVFYGDDKYRGCVPLQFSGKPFMGSGYFFSCNSLTGRQFFRLQETNIYGGNFSKGVLFRAFSRSLSGRCAHLSFKTLDVPLHVQSDLGHAQPTSKKTNIGVASYFYKIG